MPTPERILSRHRYGGSDEEHVQAYKLQEGDLFAYEWRPWQVMYRKVLPPERWPQSWGVHDWAEHTLRHWTGRVAHMACRPVDAVDSQQDRSFIGTPNNHARRLSEHYSVCARCGDLQPCREQYYEAQAAKAMQDIEKYQDEGVCPACREPVTKRQRSLTLPDNLFVPGGPPITYHIGRHQCLRVAREHERQWVAADPGRRRSTLPEPPNDGSWRSWPGGVNL